MGYPASRIGYCRARSLLPRIEANQDGEPTVKLKTLTASAGLLFLAVYGIALTVPLWHAPRQDAAVNLRDALLVQRGAAIARQGDCVACHTAPGGQPFAGGLAMQTPLGAIYSTNITPDPVTGIGRYSYGDFERTVRRGFRPDGTALYPAMPTPSYAVVSDEDMHALYAYFQTGVAAVHRENTPGTIPWPLSMRWPLSLWHVAFGPSRQGFTPDPKASAEVNRGAYLVQGLGHCGACHTPRGVGFQEKALSLADGDAFLSGAVIDGWRAKSLRGEGTGLATWSEDEIVDFLRTGRTGTVAAFGSMAEVIAHSTQHFAPEDLRSIARYLKQLPPSGGKPLERATQPDATTDALLEGRYASQGALLYAEHCMACHRPDGRGVARIFPALAGNTAVTADNPQSLVQITLAGDRMPRTRHEPHAFAMPGFAALDDEDVAAVLSFIRTGWTNRAAPVAARDIADMRAFLARKTTVPNQIGN